MNTLRKTSVEAPRREPLLHALPITPAGGDDSITAGTSTTGMRVGSWRKVETALLEQPLEDAVADSARYPASRKSLFNWSSRHHVSELRALSLRRAGWTRRSRNRVGLPPSEPFPRSCPAPIVTNNSRMLHQRDIRSGPEERTTPVPESSCMSYVALGTAELVNNSLQAKLLHPRDRAELYVPDRVIPSALQNLHIRAMTTRRSIFSARCKRS